MSEQMIVMPTADATRQKPRWASTRAFTLVLFAGFMVVMLLTLWFGLQVYHQLSAERASVEAERLAYGSLVNSVRANDAVDAFGFDSFEGNDALVMTQRTESGDFETVLFVHDGQLLQQYALAGTPIDPSAAHALFPTETFSVAYGDDGLLTLATDTVTVSVDLHSPQTMLGQEL